MYPCPTFVTGGSSRGRQQLPHLRFPVFHFSCLRGGCLRSPKRNVIPMIRNNCNYFNFLLYLLLHLLSFDVSSERVLFLLCNYICCTQCLWKCSLATVHCLLYFINLFSCKPVDVLVVTSRQCGRGNVFEVSVCVCVWVSVCSGFYF